MRPHVRRILLLRSLRPPNRFFTQLPVSRPQLPFLSQQRTARQVRFLTTERKQWLVGELRRAGKYTIVLWTSAALLLSMAFGIQQEWLERRFPSPDEWSWVTRKDYRSAKYDESHGNEDPPSAVDWAYTGRTYHNLLRRLEDPNIDGAKLEDQDEGGILVEGIGKTGYNITKKSETWRRGYYEVLMGAARAAEHLDGWVRDRTRDIFFPANMIIGPSNPNPRPIPPRAASAPKEENCEPAFEPPETYYLRALTTQGFTDRQKLDAALAYAAWLDYKGTPQAALDMYKWALDIAASSSPNPGNLFDTTGKINPNAGLISENALSATTALAVHHARNSNLATALPIMVSILRARRLLPEGEPTIASSSDENGSENERTTHGLLSTIRTSMPALTSLIIPPAYPPPPSSGRDPPPRDAKARCEEAALMIYIGEILFASSISSSSPSILPSREDGLAWTREAVDIAEEELRSPALERRKKSDKTEAAKAACRECLKAGLGNWVKMVERLAREEKERKLQPGGKVEERNGMAGGWWGLRLSSSSDEVAREKEKLRQELITATSAPTGRWEAEEQVVQERIKRASDVLGNTTQKAENGLGFI